MRMLKIFALAAVVLAVAAVAPVYAACATAKVIATSTADGQSFIWTEGWDVLYFTGLPPITGSLTAPYTADLFGVYWQLGAGDPTLGVGVDAGGNTVPPGDWIYFATYAGVYTFAGNIFENWTLPSVDLCVGNEVCECVLLTDQRDGVGYFALLSGLTTPGGDLNLTQPGSDGAGNAGPIILKPIPAPTITRIDMDMATHNMTFNVNAAAPTEGIYAKDGCNCGPVGYVMYQAIVPRDAPPPGDRDAAAWDAMTPVTPMGQPTSFLSECGGTEVDVYLATGLVFDSGMTGAPYPVTLSANSMRTLCGPTMAEPKPLAPRIRRSNPRADRTR